MKAVVVAIAMLWMCLSVELAQTERLPGHSLLLPVACAVMFWFGSGPGILIAGGALLVDWIARPTELPLVAAFLPACAILLMTPATRHAGYRRRRLPVLPNAWRLPVLTGLALVLQLVSDLIMASFSDPLQAWTLFQSRFVAMTIVAIPISVVAAAVLHFASEFGLRRAVP